MSPPPAPSPPRPIRGRSAAARRAARGWRRAAGRARRTGRGPRQGRPRVDRPAEDRPEPQLVGDGVGQRRLPGPRRPGHQQRPAEVEGGVDELDLVRARPGRSCPGASPSRSKSRQGGGGGRRSMPSWGWSSRLKIFQSSIWSITPPRRVGAWSRCLGSKSGDGPRRVVPEEREVPPEVAVVGAEPAARFRRSQTRSGSRPNGSTSSRAVSASRTAAPPLRRPRAQRTTGTPACEQGVQHVA